ncbi:MAG: AEC family transporter [Chromatiales bacterium]|jgi:predicted permease
MFATLFGIIFPVFAVSSLGYLYARWRHTELGDANRINMELFIPALIFSVMSDRSFDVTDYGSLALAAAMVVLLPGLIGWPVARFMGVQRKTFVPPLMFNNSGNMGLPLAVFAFGEEALPVAMVLFMVENTLHFTVGNWMLIGRLRPMQLLKSPMLWATFLGIAFNVLDLSLPKPLSDSISLVGQIAIPLMLFALGVRVAQTHITEWKLAIVATLLIPVTGVGIALGADAFFELEQRQAAQLLLFSVLPPAVLNYMLAEQFGQEPEKVASIVLLGNLSALLTVPAVLYFIL